MTIGMTNTPQILRLILYETEYTLCTHQIKILRYLVLINKNIDLVPIQEVLSLNLIFKYIYVIRPQ